MTPTRFYNGRWENVMVEIMLERFESMNIEEQAEFLSKIQPKEGVGNALADLNNSISDKDFWGWIDGVYDEYSSNYGWD